VVLTRFAVLINAFSVAEYALRDLAKPIGISNYELTKILPENLRGNLPTIEEIEAELRSVKIRE